MKNLSLISILVLGSLSSTLFAQDCANPLLGVLGLPGLDEPQSGADLPYCSGLQGAETCCSADTVAGFQGRADALIDKLNNYASARDLYVAQLRNSFYDRFNDIVGDINEDHLDEVQAIRAANATLADELQADIDNSNQINNDARDINNQFVAAMDEYQNARTNCFNTALQIQASSWCLACDPNYATQGVAEDGTVTLSDGLCQAINDACLPFFNQGARFNPLIRAREAYWRLIGVSRYLNNYENTNQLVPLNITQDPYNPLSTQLGVEVPEQWVGGNEETATAGQCQDLWSGDELLAELLTVGAPVGAPVVDDNEEVTIVDEEVTVVDEEANVDVNVIDAAVDDVVDNVTGNDNADVVIVDNTGTRLLQDILAGEEGVWAPDLTATGLNFDQLRNDPGDFFQASDYSDYFNTTQNATDRTDGTDDDHTDHDF